MLVLSAKATRKEQADQEAVPRQCERSANSGSLGTLLWGSNLCTCLRNLPVSLFIFVSIALVSMCPKADHNLQQFSGQHWTPTTSFWVSNVIMLLSQCSQGGHCDALQRWDRWPQVSQFLFTYQTGRFCLTLTQHFGFKFQNFRLHNYI